MFSNSRILIHRLRGVCAIRREGGAADEAGPMTRGRGPIETAGSHQSEHVRPHLASLDNAVLRN